MGINSSATCGLSTISHVIKAVFGKPGVAAPIIGDDLGIRCHDTFDEATKRIGAPVRHHREPNTSGIATVLAVIECAVVFAVPYFNGSSQKRLVVRASPFSACPPTHIGFVDLEVLSPFPPDPVLIWAHHADSELMKNLESGFVARQSELTLELNGRGLRKGEIG